MSESDEILGTLPIDIQEKFRGLWEGTLNPIIARRGPIPDPEMAQDVGTLIKIFFVHGYVAGVMQSNEEWKRNLYRIAGINDEIIDESL